MTDTTELSVEQQLDAWLEGTLAEIGDEPQDQEQADRLLWALRSARRRRAEIINVAQVRIDQVKLWAEQQTDQIDAHAHHLEHLLEGWARAEFERSGRQTFKLPAGELKVRQRRTRSTLDPAADAAYVVSAVRALVHTGLAPEVLKVTETVLPGEVKKIAEPGDEIEAFPAPEGYTAHEAVVSLDFGGPHPVQRTVAGVVLLVPKTGRDGMEFSAVTS